MEAQASSAIYAVPTYEAPSDTAWYHFLHGNVPGHQIDFIYRPEVPQGLLTQQHFSHLARLVKYIEPWNGSAFAFAIGNLSRDDTQYEPGHGGVTLIFGLRIKGAKDHAGRQDPPFCHALAAIDRHLDERMIHDAAMAFYEKLLPEGESHAEGSGWYHAYVQHAQDPDALKPTLRKYVSDFEALPSPAPSALALRWSVQGATPPRRVVIVYPDLAPFEDIARCAARIADVLVQSDIRWTTISNGREADVPGGVSVRLVPRREAGPEPEDVLVLGIDEVPEVASDIAEKLFHAHEVRSSREPLRVGWRQMYAEQRSEAEAAKGAAVLDSRPSSVIAPSGGSHVRPWASRVGLLVVAGIAVTIAGVVATIALGTRGTAASATTKAAPVPTVAVPSVAPEAREQPTATVLDAPPIASTTKDPGMPPAAPLEVKPANPPAVTATSTAEKRQPILKAKPTSNNKKKSAFEF